MGKVEKSALVIFAMLFLFALTHLNAQIFGSGSRPVVSRVQQEKVPAYKTACTRSNYLIIRESIDCFSRLDSLRRLQIQFLEARFDSLEARWGGIKFVVILIQDTTGAFGVLFDERIEFTKESYRRTWRAVLDDGLEARINSLEAMLERAHIVVVRDSVLVESWRIIGISYGFPEHFTPTDSVSLGWIWHHFTRNKISFEPEDSTQ